MPFLLLGFAALIVFLLLTRAYAGADPRALARRLRFGGGIGLLALAALMLVRGLGTFAAPVAAAGAWLLWGHGSGTWDSDTQANGPASRVSTEYLEVELDHATGQIRGRVLKGGFGGRELESLTPAETAQLWQDCRFVDPQSAQILETYLDRAHPTWREDMARTSHASGSTDDRMTRAQALEVLGLSEDATQDDIRRAHRDLMGKLHPDRGGSTFLAAQINEARDVLLGR